MKKKIIAANFCSNFLKKCLKDTVRFDLVKVPLIWNKNVIFHSVKQGFKIRKIKNTFLRSNVAFQIQKDGRFG